MDASTKRIALWLLAIPLLLGPLLIGAKAAAAADAGPDPVRYADFDPMAVYVRPTPGGNVNFRIWLDQQIRQNPKNTALLTHRAYLWARAGERERAERDYDRAMTISASDDPKRRGVLWSRGWMRYETGNAAGALDDWKESVRLHGGHPSWSPYTLALAYWTVGERELAFAWFDKYVENAEDWRGRETVERDAKHWRDPQRSAMLALHSAWDVDRHPTPK